MAHESKGHIFSNEERSSIRIKLLQYMNKNAIGAPRLAAEISTANPEKDVLLKSLQRFLSDDARTTDEIVSLFHRFANGLPED